MKTVVHPKCRCQFFMETLEVRQLFTAYFIDPVSGSDLNNGRSARTAWQTLSAVPAHTFRPKDAILLTGTFQNPSLELGSNATGVSVNSYQRLANGKVKAGVLNAVTFAGVTGNGIDITTSGITVQNINIAADPSVVASGNYNYGVYLHNATATVLSHEVINHVVATGFSYSGLCMQGWNTTAANSAGFSNVLIENSTFFANQVSGIFVGTGDSSGNEFQPDFPATLYVNSNLTITNCVAYSNPGFNSALMGSSDGVNINQGNYTAGGIFISSVNGAKVQNCTVYNNSGASIASVGLWAFDATRVNFQHDDSYDNKTAGVADGDGFDFDHGVTNSVMQYDYSHGNQGVGFLIATTGGSSNNNGDTIRYSVSDANNGGIWVLCNIGAPVLYANIYNNTVVGTDTASQNSAAVAVVGPSTADDRVNILNNIFYSAGTNPLVLLSDDGSNIRFVRNDYWIPAVNGGFNVNVNSSNGTIYTSLANWAAASGGEETFGGQSVGLVQDPMLTSESVSDLPFAGAAGLALSRTSPLRTEGFNLAARSIAGVAPFNLNAPYNLAGPAWNGLGRVNFFSRPINHRGIGAG